MAVAVAGANQREHQRKGDDDVEERPLGQHGYVSFRLEAEVLQRLGRPPVLLGCVAVGAALPSEIALRNPDRSPVADR